MQGSQFNNLLESIFPNKPEQLHIARQGQWWVLHGPAFQIPFWLIHPIIPCSIILATDQIKMTVWDLRCHMLPFYSREEEVLFIFGLDCLHKHSQLLMPTFLLYSKERSPSSATPRPSVSGLPLPFITDENWSGAWLPWFWALTSAAPLPSLVSPGPTLGRAKLLWSLANSTGTFCQRCLFLRPPVVALEVTFSGKLPLGSNKSSKS